MRELKYRAYIKPLKRYATGLDTIQFHKCCDVAGAGIWTVVTTNEGIFEGDDIVIEQYTGSKGKKGVEVCEGDIVRLYEHNWWNGKIVKHHKKPRIEGNFVVFYNDDTAAFEMKNTQPYDNGIRGEEPFGLVSQEYEVIGNIHDNAELLEKGE